MTYLALIDRLSSDCSIEPKQIDRILIYLQYPISIDDAKEYEDDGNTVFTDNGHFEEGSNEQILYIIKR